MPKRDSTRELFQQFVRSADLPVGASLFFREHLLCTRKMQFFPVFRICPLLFLVAALCLFVPFCGYSCFFPLRPLREAFFPGARVGCARSMSGPSRGSRTVEDNPPAGPIRLSGAPAGRPDNSPGPGRLGRRPGSKATTPKLSFFLLRFGAPQARQTGEGKKRAERWNANRTRHPASTPGRLVRLPFIAPKS